MKIFSVIQSGLKALKQSNGLTSSQAHQYVDLAKGATEATIKNVNNNIIELAEYAKKNNVKLHINKCEEDIVVLSTIDGKTQKKYLIVNAFSPDEKEHPLLFKIIKTIDSALAGLHNRK